MTSKEDLAALVLLVVAVLLIANSAWHLWNSSLTEMELTAEYNLLIKEEIDAINCQKQPDCDSASWTLTLGTKKSEVSLALATARREEKAALLQGVLTCFGFLLILALYPELKNALSARFDELKNNPIRLIRS